ncbi:HlyD family secretion protein [Ferrimonas marina]|uniref:HlyD family secretion protein n=1 Tax=Ferrimonas marina TaxID=299255 RepID=A0A1M5MYZ4_9GAMM|nr:HlyD family efflux transporter periplasmic adaptor subunit [Ferrimonas marina]SHG82491.1 HlyD family secretion protein [Ferrimonas marina]
MKRIGLLVLGGLLLSGCQPQHGSMALGTLERERVTHPATVSEVVVALPVAQGSQVTEGEVLARLDDRQQQAVVARSRADVARAEAQLDKLRNGARPEEVAAAQAEVAGNQASLLEAEKSFSRAQNLLDRKLASQADLDSALANRDAASARLRSAQQQLAELTNGTREEDLRIAEAELEAAQAVLASEQKRLADLTITATRSGRLDNLPWNLGERVQVGSPVAVLLVGDAPYARVYVPEPVRVRIATGDALTVWVDGIESSFQGQVRWIAAEPSFTPYYALNETDRSRLMYVMEVQLPDEAATLPNGVPAQVVLP